MYIAQKLVTSLGTVFPLKYLIRRKVLAKAFPKENNQSISVRLGSIWKAMHQDHKSVYYQAAKAAAAEHKRLYPCKKLYIAAR